MITRMLVLLAMASLCAAQQTALDRYVAKLDPVYGWKLIRTIEDKGTKAHVLELTSQTWRTLADVDQPVWKHWLTIVTPRQVLSSKALLVIGGGSNRDPSPSKMPERAALIAAETGSVVGELGMVPNQPLRFTDSIDKARSEDDLIAYTRVKHFTTKDDFWLVRLAMVKSGVRAMDAIQAFLASSAGGSVKIDQFVVSGGSKRGWTSWLVAAVDKRVVALVPIVIDALNSEAVTKHHFESYGFFSPALKDYVAHGLFPHKVGTPEYRAVLQIEDPYEYRHRDQLQIPKLLINASGDQFFLPDNSQFYYSALEGEKHIRYVPNARHNLAGSDATQTLIAFYQAILSNKPRPRFTWRKEKDGSLVVKPLDKPQQVNLWQATNNATRDFRLDTIGPAYSSKPLAAEKNGEYIARALKPAQGFTAMFVEMIYASGGKYPFTFTTEVSVVPDTVPFQWKDAAAKYPLR